jgi:hypothetical protein
VRDGTVVQAVRSAPRGYVDANGSPVAELPANRWILSGLSVVKNTIVATVYPQAEPGASRDALYVLRVALR